MIPDPKHARTQDEHGPDSETIKMACLNCGKVHEFALSSLEAQGIFNVFCDGECEDTYAARL